MKIPEPTIEMDLFGDTDPKKMPSHLFPELVSMDYSTAIRSQIQNQKPATCPRHWYIDATFMCIACHTPFVFSAQEQKHWYEKLKFYVDSTPNRCPQCRKAERTRKLNQQKPKDQRA